MKLLLSSILNAYIKMPVHRGKPRILRAVSRFFPKVPVRSKYGVQMLTMPDATTSMSIIGAYDDVFEACDPLTKGMAFVDIGANAGVFSLLAAQRVGIAGRVISFEPSSGIFNLLVNNIALNGFSNVIPFQAAVAEDTGYMSFEPGPISHTGGAHLAKTGSQRVFVLGGKELEKILKLSVSDRQVMIKIDVEGAEMFVLESISPLLKKQSVFRVIIEISPRALARFDTKPQAIYAHMEKHGFKQTIGLLQQPVYNEVFDRSR